MLIRALLHLTTLGSKSREEVQTLPVQPIDDNADRVSVCFWEVVFGLALVVGAEREVLEARGFLP
jgi:hypothetical protein